MRLKSFLPGVVAVLAVFLLFSCVSNDPEDRNDKDSLQESMKKTLSAKGFQKQQ